MDEEICRWLDGEERFPDREDGKRGSLRNKEGQIWRPLQNFGWTKSGARARDWRRWRGNSKNLKVLKFPVLAKSHLGCMS